MLRITSRLKKPLAVFVAAALMAGLGASVAFAADTVPLPSQAQTDPCNAPDVTFNASWDNLLPDDTPKIDWSESLNGRVRTAVLIDPTDTWSDGSTEPQVFTLTESGEACVVEPDAVPVPELSQTDPCNADGVTFNASWDDPLPADTAQINWTQSGDGRTRTATLKSTATNPLVWNDGTIEPQVPTLTESGEACTVSIVKVTKPPAPKSFDACNPVGVTNNMVWVDPLPADTDRIDWTKNDGDTIRTASLINTENSTWADGSVAPLVFEMPGDSGEACEVPLTKVTAVNGSFADECGPLMNLDFTPAVTEGIKYVETIEGNTITVKPELTDATKFELTNPEWSQTATDQLVACEVPLTKVTAVNGSFADECGPLMNLDFTPAVTEGIKYVETIEGNTITVKPELTDVTKFELTNPEWSQTATDQLVACDTVQTMAFICKYVGMGANERLQTGNNPIMIDRKDDMVIGSFFGDAQKRSVVIGFGNPGDPDMSISACPAPPETPDPVVTVTTEYRDNCELGYVQTRTATTTRSYAWQGTDGWVLGDPVVSYGEWVNTDTPVADCEVVYLDFTPVTVTATCGAVTFANPTGNPAVTVYYGDFMLGAPDGSVVVKPGKSVKVKTERTSLDGIVFAEGYYDQLFENVAVEQECTTPPVKPEPPVVTKPQPPAPQSEWVDTEKLVKPVINAGIDSASSPFSNPALGFSLLAMVLSLTAAALLRQRGKFAMAFARRR